MCTCAAIVFFMEETSLYFNCVGGEPFGFNILFDGFSTKAHVF